jgi:hypothetical protein
MKLIAACALLVATWWAIVFKLVPFGHMKTLVLLLALFVLQCPRADAQGSDAPDGTRVESAAVSGLDAERLSPEIRREIDSLAGQPLSTGRVDDLARRLESEQPDTVVAVRSVLTADGAARVIFLVASTAPDRDADNVNARYVIESVSVEGVPDNRLTQELRDDLKKLVGTRPDWRAIDRLLDRVHDELPGFDVSRRMSRGSLQGRLRMVLRIRPGEAMRWLHFAPSRSKLLYHTDQGWSGLVEANIGSRDWRVSPFVAASNADDSVEEYSGYGVRVEARNTGSEELGLALTMSTSTAHWRDATRQALSLTLSPEMYHKRSTVSPALTVAFTPSLHVSGGVSITELEFSEGSLPSQAANAYMLSVGYNTMSGRRRREQGAEAALDVTVGSDTLRSDFDYERYLAHGSYRRRWGRNLLLVSGMGGGISGAAPLFERFTLGDSTTLRGWDKYDIAPAGGTRVGHASVEYRNRGVAFFLDGGSIWNAADERRPRFSTGLGYHEDNFFATLAFPLNTSNLRAAFMIGARF